MAALRFSILLPLFFLTACFGELSKDPEVSRAGYRPVYYSLDSIRDIGISSVRPTGQAGKIYAYGNLIFQNEVEKGFHIVDNSDPANPRKSGFLRIPFSTEISIKGGYLYTNNGRDLVVIDIRNIQEPKVVSRIPDAFASSLEEPPLGVSSTWFECPDPRKGIITGWIPAVIQNPKCKTP